MITHTNPIKLFRSLRTLTTLLALGLSGTFTLAWAEASTSVEKKPTWQPLFDGHSLDGWKFDDKPGTFRVVDGEIVVHGPRSHLFYVGPIQNHKFKNFELSVDVKTYPHSNSGVYFHTQYQDTGWPEKGYEVQVNNSHKDPCRTAGLYGIKPNMDAVASDGDWFTMTIRVEGKRIVTAVNGRMIVDYTEEEKPERPMSFAGRLLSNGTFALQGHDPASEVHFKNIKVRVLP